MQDELHGPGRLEETKRLARVLDVIHDIAVAPRQWTRRALAAKYGIGERQIQRDLDLIRHRLLLEMKRTRDGYYFVRLPHLPTVSYSLSEALALLLAAQAGREYGVNSSELASAIVRLESVFPTEFRPLLHDLGRDGPSAGRENERTLLALQRALAMRRKVRLTCEVASRDGESIERVVCPYCLLPYSRAWYLVGYCELRHAVRTFKVERITSLEMTEEPYEVPADFSLEEAPGGAWGLMWGAAGPPEDVTLRFTADAGRWVTEETWHASQQVEVADDGSYLMRFHVGVTPEFVGWLMRHGADVRVLAPEWLRQELAERHRAAAAV